MMPDHVPRWSPRDSTELPDVRPLPLVNPHDPWQRRVAACMSKTRYRFTADYFTYCPGLSAWIFIPRNFVYDMASVPRPFSLLFMPSGVWAYPAGPHDFGYRFAGLFLSYGHGQPYRFVPLDRRDIDRVFLDLANKANNLPRLNAAATATLRLFGGCNYHPRPIGGVNWMRPVMP